MAGGSANLSDKQRNKLPDSAFCGSNRTFPVTASSDIDNAVSSLGRASDDAERAKIKACIIAKAKRFGWLKSLPQNWQDELSQGN
jgi:hypothetical protein